MTLSGVNANYSNQYQQYLNQPYNINTLGGENFAPISLASAPTSASATNFGALQNTGAEQEAQPDAVKDGKDDGHIGFWRATGHFLKGATLNFIGGILGFDPDGNWHLGQFLTNAAIIAGCAALIVATGGAATPFLAAAGVALAGTSLAKGAYQVATAETDAECESAFEQLGTGTTATVLALFGARSAQKGVVANKVAAGEMTAEEAAELNQSYSGVKGLFKSTGDLYKGVTSDIASYSKATYAEISTQAGEGAGIRAKLGATKDVLADQYKNFRTTARENYYKTVYSGENAELEARAIQDKIDAAEKEYAKYNGKSSRFKTLEKRYQARADKAFQKIAELTDKKLENNYHTSADMNVRYAGFKNDVSKYAKAMYNDVPSRWVTVNAAADRFQKTSEAKLMGMLKPEERKYFYSLPKEQREQILDQIAYAA